MLFDADSGDYNNAETLLHRIRNDDFLNTLRFSKNEVAASFKDMALLMMPVASNRPPSAPISIEAKNSPPRKPEPREMIEAAAFRTSRPVATPARLSGADWISGRLDGVGPGLARA